MTLLGFKTILHKKCRSGKNSEGPAENSWMLDLRPAKWKQISKSLAITNSELIELVPVFTIRPAFPTSVKKVNTSFKMFVGHGDRHYRHYWRTSWFSAPRSDEFQKLWYMYQGVEQKIISVFSYNVSVLCHNGTIPVFWY
jgi:hypothetical protein